MNIGENIRRWRQKRELTQPVLAERADIEQSYLSKLENNRSTPSDAVVARLAAALGIEPALLIELPAETDSSRPIPLLFAGATLFVAGLAAGIGVMVAMDPGPLRVGPEQIEIVESAAPVGVAIDNFEVIGGNVIRITGRSESQQLALQFASQLLAEGVFGEHLHRFEEKDGKFSVDFSNRPRRKP